MSKRPGLLQSRNFLPLFITQLFNAFNDNFYKTAMVLFSVYLLYQAEADEGRFSAVASALFILPFFLFSALAGQLADLKDKTQIIRKVKACEIPLMMIGATGLILAWRGIMVDNLAIPLMLLALFLTGVQSTFLGPIKYAILPQHLEKDRVLQGTGLVEAGTYIAILAGTILAGFLSVQAAAVGIIITAIIGYFVSRQIPDAPPDPANLSKKVDWNILRSSYELLRDVMRNREIFYAIIAISFFWSVGTVLFVQFPPLAKNVIMATKEVASLFLVVFSIGIVIGSVLINRMLKGTVSARFAPVFALLMGAFLALFYGAVRLWSANQPSHMLDITGFMGQPMAALVLICLLGVAITGGMFVVPLYAFLTTRVAPDKTARAVAANNIVNSGAMVVGAMIAGILGDLGIPIAEQLLMSTVICAIAAVVCKKLVSVSGEGASAAG